jgi:transposase
MNGKRPQDWSPEEKLQVVIEAATVSEEDLGAFLRRQGLHEAQLKQWRQLVLSGLKQQPMRSGKTTTADARRVRELERELTRKEKALAEAAALLILKKKAQMIWGDADDNTDKKSGSRS